MSVLPPPAPDCGACAARDERIASQQELIGELRDAVGAQADQIAALREQVAKLERAQSRNSGNSSMPPSGDDAPGRTPRRQRRAAERAAKKRSRGKQPGAPGAAMRWADPDKVIDHFAAGECPCGRDLDQAEDLGVAAPAQRVDAPEPRTERIQHDMHLSRCACGRDHVAARPPGVPAAAVSIGPNLRALAVYLLVFQHVPVERCRQLIADVAGAEVSTGFIHSCLRKAASLAADVVKLIRTLITAAHVAGFDETTLRAGAAGEKKYVHGAFTELYSACWLGRRDLDTMRDFGILPAFGGIVVSDRYQNYWNRAWQNIAGNQACAAHLARDFTDAAETYPGQVWPVLARRALSGLINAWHDARDAGQQAAIPEAIAEPLVTEFRRAIRVGLAAVPRISGPKHSTAQHPGRDLLEYCRDREDDVLRFTRDTRIWPTNNISERGVRPNKTQQKVSGRLTSDETTQDRLDIRSYIDTARKHGQHVLTVLRMLMTGSPWMPPAPSRA